jgi:type IV pilus assembly protein PilW
MSGMSFRPLNTGARRQRGRSLTELMVAIAIGLSLTATVAMAFLSTSQTARYSAGLGDAADNALTSLYLVGDSMRQAGYGEIVGSDMTLGPGDASSQRSQTLFGDGRHLGGCTGGRPIDDTSMNSACGPVTDTNFDSVFVRFQGDTVVPPAQSPITDCLGVAVPAEPLPAGHLGAARTPSRPMVQNVFFGQDGRLWCRGNGRAAIADAFNAAQHLVSDVEQFKVYYGFDDARYAGTLPTASGSVRSLRDAAFLNALPAANSPWDFVISVHMCMVVRSPQVQGRGLALRTTFTRCPMTAAEAAGPSIEVAATDGVLRRTYSHVFVVRARSPANPKEFLP